MKAWLVLRNGLVLVRGQAEGVPKSDGVLHTQLLATKSSHEPRGLRRGPSTIRT